MDNPVETAQECIRALELENSQARLLRLSERVKNETDPEKRAELIKAQSELLLEIRRIKMS